MAHLLFTNARIILPDAIADDQALVVTDGMIEGCIPADQASAIEAAGTVRSIDCKGQYLSPGFIDTHCHGGGGADFMDGKVEDILTAARAQIREKLTILVKESHVYLTRKFKRLKSIIKYTVLKEDIYGF